MGEVDEVTQRIFEALDVIPESLSDGTVGLLDRGDRDQDARADRRHARAGLVVGQTLELLRVVASAPGSPPASSTRIAEDNIRSSRRDAVVPGLPPAFPASICASVNDEVVHGIPGGRVLAEGDVISIDCGAIVDGWHGDAAITVAVGDVPAEVTELMRVTEESMWRGIAAARLGGRVTDISHAVETPRPRSQGSYGILEDYVGHGIGSAMHQPPNVPNYGRPGRGPKLVRGPRPRRRADGHPRQQGDRRCSTTTGRSSPPTAAGRRTSSTRSPSPPTAPGCSPRSTAASSALAELGVPFGGR